MALVFARYVEAFCRSKQPWFKLPPDVPTFAGYYDPAKLWPPASLARYAAAKAANARTAKSTAPRPPQPSLTPKESRMKSFILPVKTMSWLALAVIACRALAADYPAPKEGSWVVGDFRFHTGEVLPELRHNYPPVGAPTGEPVLTLHGTTGSAASMLTPAFAGELFGPGQPLDAARFYIILPDAIGTTGQARFWKQQLGEVLQAAPRNAP